MHTPKVSLVPKTTRKHARNTLIGIVRVRNPQKPKSVVRLGQFGFRFGIGAAKAFQIAASPRSGEQFTPVWLNANGIFSEFASSIKRSWQTRKDRKVPEFGL
jgi:hypothetical protein